VNTDSGRQQQPGLTATAVPEDDRRLPAKGQWGKDESGLRRLYGIAEEDCRIAGALPLEH